MKSSFLALSILLELYWLFFTASFDFEGALLLRIFPVLAIFFMGLLATRFSGEDHLLSREKDNARMLWIAMIFLGAWFLILNVSSLRFDADSGMELFLFWLDLFSMFGGLILAPYSLGVLVGINWLKPRFAWWKVRPFKKV